MGYTSQFYQNVLPLYPDMSQSSQIVQTTVESLCNEGCEAVRSYIREIENQQPVQQLTGLSAAEQLLVLKELRAIMAVYDSKQ